MGIRVWLCLVGVHAAALVAAPWPAQGPSVATAPVSPVRATEAVSNDPDDPALWVHPRDASRSLILGTDKLAGTGALFVFGLDGVRRQVLAPLDRPNNVDVEYGVPAPGGRVDIAVVTERMKHRLRVYRILPDGSGLVDAVPNGVPVLEGEAGAEGEPMGIALYRRPHDAAVFAIVAPKTGPASGYLWQYRLVVGRDTVSASFVRRFGAFSGLGPVPGEAGEIEAVAVDDELGFVYYADERFGIRKWHADPDHADASRELSVFGRSGYQGDREGLAIYREDAGRGFVVSSDQVPGATRVMVYPRQGLPGRPHDHPLIAAVPTPADETDGLDVTSQPLPGLPGGLLVMMNSGPRTFLLFDWRAIAARLAPVAAR